MAWEHEHVWVAAVALEKMREIANGFNPHGFTHETARVGLASHAHHPPGKSARHRVLSLSRHIMLCLP